MKLVERRYTATRGKAADSYQTLEVIQEEPKGFDDRGFIQFKLMEQRWRGPKEAADYLRWAAKMIEGI